MSDAPASSASAPGAAAFSARARIGLLVVASLAFSFSSPLARLARPLHPLAIACLRVAIASAILVAIDPRGTFGALRRLSVRDRRYVIAAGVLLGAHFACFQWGLDATSLPAAVALVSVEPLGVVLVAWAMFGARPRRMEIAGIFVAIAGALVVSRSVGQGEHRIAGDLLVGVAVALYGFYIAIARQVKDALSPRHYAALVYGVAAIAVAIVLPFVDTSAGRVLFPVPWTSIAAVIGIALVPTLLGHTLAQLAMRHLSPSLVALICPGETVGGIVLGMILFGIVPTTLEAAGGAIIVLGVIVGLWRTTPQPVSAASSRS